MNSIAVWDLIMRKPEMVSSNLDMSSADSVCIFLDALRNLRETRDTAPPTRGTTTKAVRVSSGLR